MTDVHRLGPGDSVVVTTIQGEVVRGSVYALDATASTLVIREPQAGNGNSPTTAGGGGSGSKPSYAYRFLSFRAIGSLEVESVGSGEDDTLPRLTADNLARLEQDWAHRAYSDWIKINENASPEGQQAFDYLSNMYPDCRWEGDSIVLMSQVRIDPPYTRSSVHKLDANIKPDFLERLLKQGDPPPLCVYALDVVMVQLDSSHKKWEQKMKQQQRPK